TPSRLVVRSPKTGTARAAALPLRPQYSRRPATLPSLCGRIRKYTTEPFRSSSFLTSRLPMKPVAPVMKYCMKPLLGRCVVFRILDDLHRVCLPEKPVIRYCERSCSLVAQPYKPWSMRHTVKKSCSSRAASRLSSHGVHDGQENPET